MATFNQGSTDNIGVTKNNVPDYNFLQQVYGVKQAQYDLGFSYLQNYAAQLKAPLSNYDNINHRNELFKKIEKSIRSVSGLDLSNQSNIGKAMQILDPISKDKELVWDMYLTSYSNQQAQLMNSAKNSDDPKNRSKYSEYSEMYIQQNIEKLKKSKRGDGSILKMSPSDFDFVAFDNVNDYLNNSKKDQGLTYERDVLDNGYIHHITNGREAIAPFSNWAFSQLKASQFDKQFSVMSKVQLENNIKSEMQKGLSREEAVVKVAAGLAPQLRINFSEEGANYQSLIDYYSTVIKTVDEKYGNNIPKNLQEKYKTYTKLKNEAEENLNKLKQDLTRLDEGGVNYMTNNLESIFKDQNYKNIAYNWGKTEAMATSKLETKPDQLYISKMEIEATKNLKYLDHALKMEELKAKILADVELKKMDAKKDNTTGKSNNPSTVEDGRYTPSDVVIGQDKVYGLDLLNKDYNLSKDIIYNNTFNQGGLLELISGNDFMKYYGAIEKLKNGQLDKEGKESLIQLNGVLGLDLQYGSVSKEATSIYLQKLQAAIYTKAVSKVSANSELKLDNDNLKFIQSFNQIYSNLQKGESLKKASKDNYNTLVSEVLDIYGNIKPFYKGEVTITGYSDGKPIFDFTNLSEDKKKHISKFLNGYSDKNEMVNTRYYTNSFSDEEIGMIFTPTNLSNSKVNTTDKNLKTNLQSLISNLSPEDFKDLVANNGYVTPNSATNSLTFSFNISPKSSTAAKLKIKNESLSNSPIPIEITMPYSMFSNSNTPLKSIINKNTLSTVIDSEIAILNTPGKTINSPSYMDATGFNYKIMKVKNNIGGYQYVVDMKYRGLNNEYGSSKQFFDSPEEAIKTSFQFYNEYLNKKAQKQSEIDGGN